MRSNPAELALDPMLRPMLVLTPLRTVAHHPAARALAQVARLAAEGAGLVEGMATAVLEDEVERVRACCRGDHYDLTQPLVEEEKDRFVERLVIQAEIREEPLCNDAQPLLISRFDGERKRHVEE